VERERRPTLEDVAALAGVSRALVSLALNDSPRVAQSSKLTIRQAASELGYRPNVAARNLASHRTGTIGVLLNDLHNPFFAEVFDGIAEAATDVDQTLLLSTGRNVAAGERAAIETMIDHRVDGIVLVGPRMTSAAIADVAKMLPTVIIGRTVRDTRVDCVTNHDAEGARIAVAHLVELGHQSIVHIDGGAGAGAAARRAGFVRAVTSHGLDRWEVIPGDYTERGGLNAARRLLKRKNRPTAVFGANDLVAVGVLDLFVEAGLRVPEDLSVIGYDNSQLSRLSRLSLSTIDQSTDRLGRVAVELLRSRIDGRTDQRLELVTPTLIARRTTAPTRIGQ
jgi:DNA-binding LacI/PurR family transcriptional regulator